METSVQLWILGLLTSSPKPVDFKIRNHIEKTPNTLIGQSTFDAIKENNILKMYVDERY